MNYLHLSTLQKYYDAPTLRAWISRYESSYTTGKRAEQIERWRRVLAELENLEPSPIPAQPQKPTQTQTNFDDYTQLA